MRGLISFTLWILYKQRKMIKIPLEIINLNFYVIQGNSTNDLSVSNSNSSKLSYSYFLVDLQ